jgi:3D (Asp-Asp-Asp) domain-containing protein
MPVVLAPEPVVEWQTFEVTAYTSGPESTGKRPGDVGYGITASGEHVRENYTLACPPSMAFGTRLEIEGIGERVCADRGGAIKEGRLDVYIAELEEARQFGRQRLNVRIIE